MKEKEIKKVFEEAQKRLEDLFFEVKLRDVYIEVGEKENSEKVIEDHFKAVYNENSKSAFSIVTKNYELTTNKKAVQTGKELFEKAFPTIKSDEIKPFQIYAPQTKSYMYARFIHEKINFEVAKDDVWLPFIQVANSYNKMVALSYEFGFVRGETFNAFIFEKNVIKVKDTHTKTNNIEVQLAVIPEQLKTLEMRFKAYVENIRRYYIEPHYVFPLVCKALHLKKDENQIGLKKRTKELQKEKFTEHNAYAFFNILSTLISEENKHTERFNFTQTNLNRYSRKPIEWLRDFVDEIKLPTFEMKKYLGEFIDFENI